MVGVNFPLSVGLTFAHKDFTGPSFPLYVKLMSASSTFWHGKLLLQLSRTATAVAEEPLIFLKVTLEILTFDGSWNKHQKRQRVTEISCCGQIWTHGQCIKRLFHFHFFSRYLWIALIPWAVHLIYNDRVADIFHHNILEMHIRGHATM